jgi:hypothetical protein
MQEDVGKRSFLAIAIVVWGFSPSVTPYSKRIISFCFIAVAICLVDEAM